MLDLRCLAGFWMCCWWQPSVLRSVIVYVLQNDLMMIYTTSIKFIEKYFFVSNCRWYLLKKLRGIWLISETFSINAIKTKMQMRLCLRQTAVEKFPKSRNESFSIENFSAFGKISAKLSKFSVWLVAWTLTLKAFQRFSSNFLIF